MLWAHRGEAPHPDLSAEGEKVCRWCAGEKVHSSDAWKSVNDREDSQIKSGESGKRSKEREQCEQVAKGKRKHGTWKELQNIQ